MRPEVTVDNAEAVYHFYSAHQQNKRVARVAYQVLARRFRPRVTYVDSARERLRQLVYDDARLIIAINHVSETDPYTVAAAAWASPLRPIVGRTRVLAKDELFVDPRQRRRVDMMGAIPVFRGKNHGMRQVNAAAQRMLDVCAERLRMGDDLAVFPEGTCNDGDPTVLQQVGSGLGHIVARARRLDIDPVLVVMGIHYGPGDGALKSASVVLDVPEVSFPDKPLATTRLVAQHLQSVVDHAVARY